MKTRTLQVALAGILAASFSLAADLPAPSDDESAAQALHPAKKGDVHSARKNWAQARDAYIAAIAESATLYNKLGMCEQRLGNAPAARKAYRTAVELRPEYAEAWNNLGTLDHARKEYEAAIGSYERSIALDPTDPVVFRNLGQAWLALDDVERTLEAWSQAMHLDPAALMSTRPDAVQVGELDLARQYFIYAKLVAADGDVDNALELLGVAREHGFDDFAQVERDPDFASVVQDPRWPGWTR